MIYVKELTYNEIPDVEIFCEKAKHHGFKNNSSLETLNFYGSTPQVKGLKFWGLYMDNDLFGISGAHFWDDLADGYLLRCLYRSAVLPEYFSKFQLPLNRYFMNDFTLSVLLPYQILYGVKSNVSMTVFTTTADPNIHDTSNKMKNTFKAMHLLSKYNVVENIGIETIYSTKQIKWKLNLSEYFKIICKFHPIREKLKIDLSPTYYNIIQNGFVI